MIFRLSRSSMVKKLVQSLNITFVRNEVFHICQVKIVKMLKNSQEKLCLYETKDSVTSISTMDFVPQPLNEKSHFVRNRIFVGNFPDTATPKDISNVFSQFGRIIETNIIDSRSAGGRYGFVTFQSIDSADAVLSLYSRGREFKVNGEVITINHALFKPKKCINAKSITNDSRPMMTIDGRSVIAEYVNGMVYFRPVQDKKVELPPQINTALTRAQYPLLPPPFQLTNHLRFSVDYPTNLPVYQYPTIVPPRNIFSLASPAASPARPMMQPTVPSQISPCYPLLGSSFGTMPIIR